MTANPLEVRWPVTTPRLTIRPAVLEDLPQVFEYRRKPEVAQWLTAQPTDVDTFVERLGQPEQLAAIFVVEHAGTLVGDLYLVRQDAWAQKEIEVLARGTQAEIGYVIAPEYAGRGYASEAVAELVRICFEELGLRRVVAECFADNTASWRVMEKTGMRREGRSRQGSLHRSGRWLDDLRYALLADEWRGRRAGSVGGARRQGQCQAEPVGEP
ncbi:MULTISPECIES: GNAT family N-acetyltransferase [unclassified Arthrobacter]|uniref:GNAT family N-acetyltransferase n=1 Tax=unclassified Arthrobacter TaxID=235627 RepID=UPI001D15501D|nr:MULTISPECIES: GNAT family protein [unclassified Arthrobacter]MCC3291729.1 GNAT family N-acetyltransferase [Arthrobacter sp. zg-Y1110]MCC3302106.1 GNAT family N-acetyltransferase [Arthrobacter sp. zg-Y895]UWX85569.1 GNAT family N-acetyltransferase [Arthrobacter sp. zg-Y1110]